MNKIITMEYKEIYKTIAKIMLVIIIIFLVVSMLNLVYAAPLDEAVTDYLLDPSYQALINWVMASFEATARIIALEDTIDDINFRYKSCGGDVEKPPQATIESIGEYWGTDNKANDLSEDGIVDVADLGMLGASL